MLRDLGISDEAPSPPQASGPLRPPHTQHKKRRRTAPHTMREKGSAPPRTQSEKPAARGLTRRGGRQVLASIDVTNQYEVASPPPLPTVAPTRIPTVHSLPPYCCPYPCPYCTLTPSLPSRSPRPSSRSLARPPPPAASRATLADETCPFSTGGGTRRVRLVRGKGGGGSAAAVVERFFLPLRRSIGSTPRGGAGGVSD
jgi:hypothetical protein